MTSEFHSSSVIKFDLAGLCYRVVLNSVSSKSWPVHFKVDTKRNAKQFYELLYLKAAYIHELDGNFSALMCKIYLAKCACVPT